MNNQVEHKRRVGLLVDSLVGGGAERVALNFAETFRRLGHDAHVIIIRNEIEHDTGQVPVHALSETGVLSRTRPINKFLLARRLREVIAKIEGDGKKFDFFISNAEDMDRLSAMAKLPLTFIRYRNAMTPVIRLKIGNARGLKRHIRTLRWYGKFRRIYGGRHIVTVSRELEREIVQDVGIQPASITTIYNPFDFERIRRLAGEHDADIPAEPYIIYAGRLSGRKAQHDLLKAYARSGLKQKLVLLGGTTSDAEREYEGYLHNLIGELGLKGSVIFPGFKKNPYPWIKHAVLFAMSSVGEGLPTVLIESLILGTPVVSTDCPTGPKEILEGELARFLSPVGDVEKLAENMRAALDDYPDIDESSLARFRDEFSISRYLECFEKIQAAGSI